jgi:PAS domain S-box-containing protein
MVEEADEGIWVIDTEHKTTYANEAIANMLGYASDEMIGMPIFAFMDDEGKAIAAVNMERRKKGEHAKLEFKYIRKDGSDFWAHIATHPMMDAHGVYTGAYAIVTDINEAKLRERALLDTLHASSPDDLWGAALPVPDKPVVRMPEVFGARATRVARRFSILADARRLELIELLASGDDTSVTSLAGLLSMTPSNVSKHLRILSEAGLVTRRQDATKTFYSLTDPTVAILCRIVCRWLGNQAEAELNTLAS